MYAEFLEQESTWSHIEALQTTFLTYGLPLKYYADQHRIFRQVKERDVHSPWYDYKRFTDDVDPQWKQVLKDCEVQVTYALSPQEKGKSLFREFKFKPPFQSVKDIFCLQQVKNQDVPTVHF